MPSIRMCCRAAFIVLLVHRSCQIRTPGSESGVVLTRSLRSNTFLSQSPSSSPPSAFARSIEVEKDARSVRQKKKRARRTSDDDDSKHAFRKSLRSSAPDISIRDKRNSSISPYSPPRAGHRRAKRQRARRSYCESSGETPDPKEAPRIRRSLQFSESPFNRAPGTPVTPEDEADPQMTMAMWSAKKDGGRPSDTSTEEECALDTQWLMQGGGDMEMSARENRQDDMMSESWWRRQRFVDFKTGEVEEALAPRQLRGDGWRPTILGRTDIEARPAYGDESHDLFTVIGDGWHPTPYILRVSNCRTEEEVRQHAAETAMNYVFAARAPHHVLRCVRMWRRGGRSFAMSSPCASTLQHHLLTLFGAEREDAYMPRRAVEIVRQILDGLATIHRNGYVHADLNPSTILVMADGVVQIGALHKIVDAKRGVGALCHSNRAYLAPELAALTGAALGTNTSSARPSLKVDDARKSNVFAAGLILFQLLTAKPSLPSRGQEWSALRGGVSIASTDPLLWGRVFAAPYVPYPEWHLVERMLDSDPRTRPSAPDLLGSLNYFRESGP